MAWGRHRRQQGNRSARGSRGKQGVMVGRKRLGDDGITWPEGGNINMMHGDSRNLMVGVGTASLPAPCLSFQFPRSRRRTFLWPNGIRQSLGRSAQSHHHAVSALALGIVERLVRLLSTAAMLVASAPVCDAGEMVSGLPPPCRGSPPGYAGARRSSVPVQGRPWQQQQRELFAAASTQAAWGADPAASGGEGDDDDPPS